MDKSFTIFAIIVTYNGSKWIDKCIGSLINSSIPIKILAIDNASTDGTPDIIREKFPQVEVIETGQNLGFGKANNIGLKRVLDENADYAFLLNQDAWVEYDTIEQMVKISHSQSQYGILSPIHMNGNGDMLDYAFESYLERYSTKTFYSDLYLNKLNTIYTAQYANAAAWLLPLNTINIVGLFNPIFPHYGEDSDYIVRLKYHNLKIGIIPNCKINHDRNQYSNSSIENNFKRILINDYGILLNVNYRLHFLIRKWLVNKAITVTSNLLHLKFTAAIKQLACFLIVVPNFMRLVKLRVKAKQKGAFI